MMDTFSTLSPSNPWAGFPAEFYTQVKPQPLQQHPRILHLNQALAAEWGWPSERLADPAWLDIMAGRLPLPGVDPIATVYSGHQFGVWAGQLGDGRAHLLGEISTPEGPVELQLKGSGRTPYSRMGDGRAVLRSTVREYLASEAMHGLGIPTTRALGMVVSDDPVYRETVETAAIILRTSPSFVRFGTFEHFARQPDHLKVLLDHVIDRFYPDCRRTAAGDAASQPDVVLCFLEQVARRTARLIAQWLTVGFCHGVMNTDNMSVLGLTIDYGPYGFMDAFQANHICNLTDTQGRYAWHAQASVAYWNLHRLAGSLMALGPSSDELKQAITPYEAEFLDSYRQRMLAKLGLQHWQPDDDTLMDNWWRLLHENRSDFTLSFLRLAEAPEHPDTFISYFDDGEAARNWLDAYRARVDAEGQPISQRRQQMQAVNPVYVLRNHLAQQAIDAAERGDASEIDTLLSLLRYPFAARPGFEAYAQPPAPDEAVAALSCSS